MPENDFQDAEQSIQLSENKIQTSNIRGIFSFYDPFKIYTIENQKLQFRISQLTNGSVYFGSEDDGTVSVYSIDLVAKLTFLHQNEDMSEIIIFPGMYIRFDPTQNIAFKNANLFHILTTLNSENSLKNTGVEFVDPRLKSSDKQVVFFMYRLPKETRKLFLYLHTYLSEKVRAVNLLETYAGKTGV